MRRISRASGPTSGTLTVCFLLLGILNEAAAVSSAPSTCISGTGNNVCFTPYEHLPGSIALTDAVEAEMANKTSAAGKALRKLRQKGAQVFLRTSLEE